MDSPLTPYGEEVADDAERKAIAALHRLGKQWPRSLTLASMGGSLIVVRTDDAQFQDGAGPERAENVLAYLPHDIPNTGGDW